MDDHDRATGVSRTLLSNGAKRWADEAPVPA